VKPSPGKKRCIIRAVKSGLQQEYLTQSLVIGPLKVLVVHMHSLSTSQARVTGYAAMCVCFVTMPGAKPLFVMLYI